MQFAEALDDRVVASAYKAGTTALVDVIPDYFKVGEKGFVLLRSISLRVFDRPWIGLARAVVSNDRGVSGTVKPDACSTHGRAAIVTLAAN